MCTAQTAAETCVHIFAVLKRMTAAAAAANPHPSNCALVSLVAVNEFATPFLAVSVFAAVFAECIIKE